MWIKKGNFFNVNKNFDWMQTHATLPIAYKVNEEILRIYFSTRNKYGKSYPAYIEVDINDFSNIIKISEEPLLQLGDIGTFDDSGIMFSSFVEYNGKMYMYYIGWNQPMNVSYRLAIGLAISEDGGRTFSKYSNGPIIDRSIDNPIFATCPYVLKDGDTWRIWYTSCTEWIDSSNKAEPIYNTKYGESLDGVNWKFHKNPCVDYLGKEAIARPWIIKSNGIYKMWYSTRGEINYRENKENSYRIGYAESLDGITWIRKDLSVGINVGNDGWDSQMICYSSIFVNKDKLYMLYNGNIFGKSGIGYAIDNNEI